MLIFRQLILHFCTKSYITDNQHITNFGENFTFINIFIYLIINGLQIRRRVDFFNRLLHSSFFGVNFATSSFFAIKQGNINNLKL